MRVGVVGGGVVGLAVAGDLAERGVSVTLYERGELGAGATGRAAGICYDAFADPTDAAVAQRALERYREWDLLADRPYVWVAREESDATAIAAQVTEMRANGVDAERLDPATLGERYPELDTGGVTVAAIAHSAGVLDPEAVLAHLTDRARATGAVVRTGTTVSLAGPRVVETPGGVERFDAVVVAAGPATKPIVADVGVSLALGSYRAQALVTGPVGADLPSFYDATREFYWRPHDDGLLVGDGAHAVDPADCATDADPDFVRSALDRVTEATTLDPSVDRAWAGCCTATPDRDPLVGPVADGCWVATGWQGHGLMRAPAMGEFVAQRLRGGASRLDAPLGEQFDPNRFDCDESFHPLGDPTADW